MILKGLPKEFAPFASAIRTRDDSISFEKLSVLLQTEEQSMTEVSDPSPILPLQCLFPTITNLNNGGFNGNQGYNRGRGEETHSIVVEVEDHLALIQHHRFRCNPQP
jgi:hypothetical protein